MEGYKRLPKPVFVGVFSAISLWGIQQWIGKAGERPVNRIVVATAVVAAVLAGTFVGTALCNHRMQSDLRPSDLLLPSEIAFVVYGAAFHVLTRDWFYKYFYVGTSGRQPENTGFEWRTMIAITILVPLVGSWLPSTLASVELSIRIERIVWAVLTLGCLALTFFLLFWGIGLLFMPAAAFAWWSTLRHQDRRIARRFAIRGDRDDADDSLLDDAVHR